MRPFIRMVANQISASFIDPIIKTNFSLMDQALSKDSGRQFLAGGREPTAGDFMVGSDTLVTRVVVSLADPAHRCHILSRWPSLPGRSKRMRFLKACAITSPGYK